MLGCVKEKRSENKNVEIFVINVADGFVSHGIDTPTTEVMSI